MTGQDRRGGHALRAKRGMDGLVLHRPSTAGQGERLASLELASLFAEREAQGAHDHIVTVFVDAAADQVWTGAALRWLAEHGRQPVIRARVSLSRELVEVVAEVHAVVEFELAHPRVELQRALLGPQAASTSNLLLQAQHLRALGVEVAARLGPLLPGLHDAEKRNGFGSLLSHVRAADIGDVEIALGDLSAPRLAAVADLLSAAELLELGRAFGLTSGALLHVGPDAGEADVLPAFETTRLDAHFAQVWSGQLRRAAETAGLRVETTSTLARKAARRERRTFVGLVQGDLFFGT